MANLCGGVGGGSLLTHPCFSSGQAMRVRHKTCIPARGPGHWAENKPRISETCAGAFDQVVIVAMRKGVICGKAQH